MTISNMLRALAFSVFTTTCFSLPYAGIQTSQYTPFNLVTTVTYGQVGSLNQLYITGTHTGAGQMAPVAVPYSPVFAAGGYILNNTFINIAFANGVTNLPTYSLGLQPGGVPLIPNISGTINQNVNLDSTRGQQTSGFEIDDQMYIRYVGNAVDFATFVLCSGPARAGGNNLVQLLWRDKTSQPDYTHCSDVRLSAVFPYKGPLGAW